jgi:hypothetical protein
MMLDKLDRLEPREKMGLVLAMFVILAFLVDRLVVSPVAEMCRDLDASIRAETENLSLNKAVLQQRDQVLRQYGNVARELGSVNSSAQEIDAMKGRLDELAVQSGVKFFSREQVEPRAGDAWTEYAVAVGEFEASMEGLVRFLAELPAGEGMTRAARITLTPDRNRNVVKGSMLITKLALPTDAGGQP